jgi:DNA polymerase-3 subunit delta'
MTFPWLLSLEEEFRDRLQNGRLAHALLLAGPAGIGKRVLARELVASVMCQEGRYPACGECRSCQLLKSGAHPDRFLLTFEENPKTGKMRKEIAVGQVRDLIASMQLTRSFSPYKAALIHPAEGMNKSAANALLKTLEEPPGDAVMVLVSDHAARLPATIRSRCQAMACRLPEASQAREWLCSVAACDAATANLALEAAAWSPLQARKLLADGEIDHYRLVTETLRALRSGQQRPVGAMAAFAEIEPPLLWSWLSLAAAGEIRKFTDDMGRVSDLCRLQQQADRFRALVPTPVRKDFLLQDWLIQWTRLKV